MTAATQDILVRASTFNGMRLGQPNAIDMIGAAFFDCNGNFILDDMLRRFTS